MASSRFAWGIDVGNRALKAVKLVRDGDNLRVDDFEVIEHEMVLSNAGDNRAALIQAALTSFIQRHPAKGGMAAIGVSGQSSFARFIKLPPVEPKKIPEIVRFEAIQQIPFPLDDVEWSYQLFQNVESPDVEVGIFAMRRDLINQHMKFFTDVDLNVQVVQMNPLAVYNAMYHDRKIDGTTMIIDMGAENTDLIIAEGETVWLRSIPIGGNNFTEALVKAFKLNFAKAEEMKRNAPTSKYARQIFQAMRPVFADLVAEVQRSIGFYASTHRDSRIKKIISLGGTFRLPGLQKYLQQNLQLDVQRLDGFAAGAPPDGKLATTFNENLLSMTAAYGLAIQAMGDAKINSSLLPQYIRRAKLWKEKTKWFAAAAALFIVGTGIAYGSLYLNGGQYNSQRALDHRQKIDRILRKGQDLDRQWSEIEQAGSGDRQIINNINSLLAYRDLWPEILLNIHRSLPQPQPEVLTGKREEIKKVPRDERTQIVIDSITSKYYSDLATILADQQNWTHYAPDAAGSTLGSGGTMSTPSNPAGGTGAAAAPAAQRGFLITIVCTSPHKLGSEFVTKTLLTNLDKLQPGPNLKEPFYVARSTIAYAESVEKNSQRMQALQAAYTAAHSGVPIQGGGGPAGGGAGRFADGMEDVPTLRRSSVPFIPPPNAATATPVAENPYVDRVTLEDVRQDKEFKVVVAVVLDPPKEAAASPATQAAPTAP